MQPINLNLWQQRQQEQVIEIKQTLRYLGVPIKSKSYMIGDKMSVVTSATLPHSLLSKRHNILSYHRVREDIVAMIISFFWCDSKKNKSDLISKQWDNSKMYCTIQVLSNYQGKIYLFPKDGNSLIPEEGE